MDFWTEMEQPGPRSVVVDGVEISAGSRVILRPHTGGDILDLALTGRSGRIESLEQDQDGQVHVVVTLEDDPGRDLGEARMPGHRFFFSVEEVEPLDERSAPAAASRRILVAGIGNIFLGDDGFGVEVAKRLAERPRAAGVEVVDFGIRGMDLAYALQNGYDAAILVDATPRGEAPGTLYVIEPEVRPETESMLDTHGMDPVKVLRLVGAMGGIPPRTLVVGCEPLKVLSGEDYEDVVVELSEPVRRAVDEAVRLIESLLDDLIDGRAEAGNAPAAE